jgi:hypothetical protein
MNLSGLFPEWQMPPVFPKCCLQNFPKENEWRLSFIWTGFVSFMIAQPIDIYRLATVICRPDIFMPNLTDKYTLPFLHIAVKNNSFCPKASG